MTDKTCDELAANMDQSTVEYLRELATMSDEDVEKELMFFLEGRDHVANAVSIFVKIIVPDRLADSFALLMGSMHYTESSITAILAEREQRIK